MVELVVSQVSLRVEVLPAPIFVVGSDSEHEPAVRIDFLEGAVELGRNLSA